jgi:hypothetical protein
VLTRAHEERLDSLARQFLNVLRSRTDLGPYQAEFTDRLKVTFPARHPETGNLVVRLDYDEVTVSIGDGFHTHFPTFGEDIPIDQREQAAVEEAVAYIEDFLADRLVLRLRLKNGMVRSGETFPIDAEAKPLGPGERDYLWSGPRPAA